MSNKKTVGKQLMSFALQQKHSLTTKAADEIIETLFETIQQELLKGNSVNFLNIGSIVAIKKEIGQTRKAFGTEIKVSKGVILRCKTSNSFIQEFEKCFGKTAAQAKDLNALSAALKS